MNCQTITLRDVQLEIYGIDERDTIDFIIADDIVHTENFVTLYAYMSLQYMKRKFIKPTGRVIYENDTRLIEHILTSSCNIDKNISKILKYLQLLL